MTTRRELDAPAFTCHVAFRAGRVTLFLCGELDIAGAAEARRALMDLEPTRGGWLVLDLRDLLFMDSNGVRLILQAMESADRHGATFVVIRGPYAVQRVLEVVGLAEQLLIVDELGATFPIDEEA